jgi:GLPGLI family protein
MKNEVIYTFKVAVDSSFMAQLNDNQKTLFSKAMDTKNTLSPKLLFNDSLAYFYLDSHLVLDKDIGHTIAEGLCNCKKPIYNNFKKKVSIYNNGESMFFIDDQYLITKPIDTGWVLLNEFKEINGYTCYKATRLFKYNNGMGDFEKTITAWYCPELPYAIGPNGHGGLPGLIFELHDQLGLFGIEAINFNVKNRIIKKPNNGRPIYFEAFEEIYKEKVSRYIKEQEKN